MSAMQFPLNGLGGRLAALLTGLGAAALVSLGAAGAQQIHGAPGAPDSTITIDGHVLPPPPQKFGGEIELNAAQSKPYWPASVVPPKGAPNILLIMTDDVGFAVVSEAASGFPGYNSLIGRDSATVGRILRENGYRTAWFGKDHNTPTY